MAKQIFTFFGILLLSISSFAQTSPFNIEIEPMNISGLGGLQSFAVGQHNGKWLIIGGRLDGLHRRQPFAAFDVAGNNNQVIVVDPIAKQKWSASLSTLSIPLQEQLSSANMQFHQDGDYLYLLGGYGFNATSNSKKTFGNLTAVNVPQVINAVVAGTSVSSYFRQINDMQFAVTGGQLEKIDNTFYLVGGNKFDGNYNPNGGASYTQVYTDAIRKFNITDDGTTISIDHLTGFSDANQLHRRDFNAVAQILPNGSEGISAFSGVFQRAVDLPFLNSVTINRDGYEVNNTFQQFYNHYHCAVLPLYSVTKNEMHTVFFGGIAQYYDNNGTLVQDNNVPFVKTIARVTRDAQGTMSEYKLPIEMPNFLGAGSEFIPLPNLPRYDNGVFKLDDLPANRTLVGFIYGGISSTAANIFFTNNGDQSNASSQIFKVYVNKNTTLATHDLNKKSLGNLKLQISPVPNNGNFEASFKLMKSEDVKITLYSIDGKLIEQNVIKNGKVGDNKFQRSAKKLDVSGTYLITVETSTEEASQKILIKK